MLPADFQRIRYFGFLPTATGVEGWPSSSRCYRLLTNSHLLPCKIGGLLQPGQYPDSDSDSDPDLTRRSRHDRMSALQPTTAVRLREGARSGPDPPLFRFQRRVNDLLSGDSENAKGNL